MALHKAERIIVAIYNLVYGTQTVGESVRRARNFVWDNEELPGLTVLMGGDDPIEESAGLQFIDHRLTVDFNAYIREFAYEGVEKTLTDIRTDVCLALLADRTLGLDFVIDVIEGYATQPTIIDSGDRLLLNQQFSYEIHYRRNRLNPTL